MFDFTHQDLRRYPTFYERVLWKYLRARRMVGLKFRRQHPMGPFIVDFICISQKFIIEVDGSVHDERKFYDQKRDLWLQSKGYTIMRIKNEELGKNRDEVLIKIRMTLLKRIGYLK